MNLLLKNNTAPYGVANIDQASNVTFSGSYFINNNGPLGYGSALSSSNSNITIINSTFSGNSGKNGPIVASSGTFTMHNSTICSNTAQDTGGLLFDQAVTALVNSSLIFNNSAGNDAGAFMVQGKSNVNVMNSQVFNNNVTDSNGYGAAFSLYDSHLIVSANSVISGNTATVYYS